MRSGKFRFLLLLLMGGGLLAAFIGNGICGIVIHKQRYRVIPGKGRTQLLQSWIEYVQDNKIAVYQKDAIFITDIGANTLINIIPSRKIYAVNDIDEFIQKINKIVEQIKAQPEWNQDKTVQGPINIKVKGTGKTKNFLGYPCKEVEIFSNGKKMRILWLTDKIPLNKEIDVDKAREKRFKIEEIFVALSGSKDIEATPEYKSLFKGGKVSMMTISNDTGTEEIERVTQVEITTIPQKIFEVPEGFKKVPIEKFMQH